MSAFFLNSCGHQIPKEMKLKQEKEGRINQPSNFCLPHSKIYTVDHLSSMLSHKQFLFTIYDRFMLLLFGFLYFPCGLCLILGEQSQLTFGELLFHPRWPIQGCGIFIKVLHVWHSTLGTLWLPTKANVKQLPMLSNEKLPAYWSVTVVKKRDDGCNHIGVVNVGTSTLERTAKKN